MNVSVLIPVLNGEKYLRASIESVLKQDLVCEILVMDNGSTDRTQSIVQSLMELDPRVKYHFVSSPGISNALNAGLQIAQNEFVARLDSDDIMLPNRIRTQTEFLMHNPEVSVVGSQVTFIDVNGKPFGTSSYPVGKLSLVRNFSFRNPIAHPSVMFRKSTVINVEGYRSQFDGAEDLDLWLRVMSRSEINVLPEALTSYRIHNGQISGSLKTYAAEKKVRLHFLIKYHEGSKIQLSLFYILQIFRIIDLSLLSLRFLKPIRSFLKKLLKLT